MNVENHGGDYVMHLAPASECLMSEARVFADVVGMYWDYVTGRGDDLAQRYMAKDLFDGGVGSMHDAFRDATLETHQVQSVRLNTHQLMWLGQAAEYFCTREVNRQAGPYDIVAQQAARTLLLKIEENR